MKERYDSLTNSVKESSIIEPSVPPPATGRKVSIPEAFNSPSPSSTPPHTSPAHKPNPPKKVAKQNGTGTEERSLSQSPKVAKRFGVGGGSPVPSPKTRKKGRMKSTGDAVGNGNSPSLGRRGSES